MENELTYPMQVMRYVILVPTTTLYYDHILTFAKEVEWVWKRKLTVPTIIFLFLRYSTTFWDVLFIYLLFGIHTPFFTCTFMIKAPMIYFSLHDAGVEAILMLRTYALYSCNKTVLFTLSTYIVMQLILTVIITLRIIILDDGVPDSSAVTVKLPVCRADMHGIQITLFWWLALGFDTIVFTLTYLQINRLRKWVTPKNSPLLKLLTRDGLIFYVVICFLNLLNVWCYFFLGPELRVLGVSFSMNLSTTMISRLVLNIQDVSQQMIGRFSDRPTSATTSRDSTTGNAVLTTAPSVFIESRFLMAWGSFHDLHRVNVSQDSERLPP